MRTIKTKDGQVHSGFNSEFKDMGTHIEKEGLLSKYRIYKENISSDKESNVAGAVATSAVVFTVTGGVLM